MKRSQLESIIQEELYKTFAEVNVLGVIDEKSVPEPYNRKERRRMTGSQIQKRDKIGNAMKNRPATVKQFQEKHGDDWEYYLWAAATNKAISGA
jgi:hypothetical protein